MFDLDYDFTICNADGNGTTWYFKCPVPMHGHHVNIVYYDIGVNPDGSRVKFPSGFYHCVNCKLMGTLNSMQEYRCAVSPRKA